jgi:hypothetical protein
LALLAYAGAFAVTWQVARGADRWVDGYLLCGIVIGGAALWFMALQAFVLHAFCPYCVAAHTIGLVIAVLFFRHYRALRPKLAGAAARPMAPVWVAGFVALGILVSGQFLLRPSGVVQVSLPAAPAGASPATRDARFIELPGNQGRVPVTELPVVGARDSTNVVFCLFDYTCAYCRTLHGMLRRQLPPFTNNLAFVLLVTPLSTNCNPSIPRTPPQHKDACDYAQVALAVWRARPDLFFDYHEWLLASNAPPSLESMRSEAEKRVGADKLGKALTDPWIGEALRRNGRIYAEIYRTHKGDMLPELITPNRVTFGTFSRPAFLDRVLREAVGLPSMGTNPVTKSP